MEFVCYFRFKLFLRTCQWSFGIQEDKLQIDRLNPYRHFDSGWFLFDFGSHWYRLRHIKMSGCIITQSNRAPNKACTRPPEERRDCRGGSLRVFRQFSWLRVGSVKAALSRPAHRSTGVLLRLPDGKYAQGNAGEVRTLFQRAVQKANRSQLLL